MRPLSLAPLTAFELTPPELVTCAAQAGYSHLGMRLVQGAPPLCLDPPTVEETRRRLLCEGVQVLEIEVVRLDGQTVVDDCKGALDVAALLGGRHLVAIADDPEPQRLVAHFARLCELAAGYGLTVDIEPIPYYRTATTGQASDLIAAAGAANGGVLIDPLHFDRSGQRLEDVAAIPLSQLHYVQLCDAPAERPTDRDELIRQAREERLFPGEGDLDLVSLLRALPADLPVSVEIPRTALSRTVGPLERARMALEATKAVLARV